MRRLLDVNVLIALAWPSHVHHEAACRWFEAIGNKSWATCPLTRLGFVRVSSNPRFIDGAVIPAEAHRLLVTATKVGDHVFWMDDVDPLGEEYAFHKLTGHQQVTDAYLIALAAERGGRVATFDQGALTLAEDNAAVEVLSV